MFASASKHLARGYKGVDYQAVRKTHISTLSTVKEDFLPCYNEQSTNLRMASSRQQCLHTITGEKYKFLRPVMDSSSFGRVQQYPYSGKDVAHIDGVQSAELEINLQIDHKTENGQKLKEKDSRFGKQTNKSPSYNNNNYISKPWTSIEPESMLQLQSKSENEGQPDNFSKGLIQFHGVEEVSPLYGSNSNVSMESANQFSLYHMPDFQNATELYYTVTRIRLIRSKFLALYRNNCHKEEQAAAQKLVRHAHSVMYCCPAEVSSCMQILKKFGVPLHQLGSNCNLLVHPSASLKARVQLVCDMGLHSSSPIVCLSRLEDLMNVPETELIERNFLPDDSSLLERLLSKLGSDHVLEEQQLRHEQSQTNTLKETYNKILAGLLAHRFAVSTSSVESLLHRYQPSYKPLSHYYLIADIIDKHLRLNFEQVSQQPALLDLSPQDTLTLLQLRPFVAGRPTVEALCACPDLGRIPHTLLRRWLGLLDAHSVLQFPLDGIVPWVLKQDLLVMARLVLNFLVYHPEWQNIKSSQFLFEIFVNPGVMNDLMKDVDTTDQDFDSFNDRMLFSNEVSCSSNDPSPAVAEEELKAWEKDIDNEAAAGVGSRLAGAASPRWNYSAQDEDGVEATDGEEPAGGGSYVDVDEDTDDDDDATDIALEGLPSAPADAGVPAELNFSDRYITCYEPRPGDLNYCIKKNRLNAEVKSYLQTKLKIDASEANRVGRHGAAPCSLHDAIAKLQLLLRHGYTTQQIAVAVEIFGYEEELLHRELCLIKQRFTNYEEYWRRHPNVVNLLLYYVTKMTKNEVCDESAV